MSITRKLFVCITIITAMVIAGCNVSVIKKTEEIYLNKYIEYSISGYSSKGTITYEIKFDDIIDDYELDGLSEKKLAKKITGFWDKTNELANGDTITFKWNIDTDSIEEEYNVKFNDSDLVVTVTGLDELPVYDPFEYIEMSFSGIAPNGSASIENVGSNPLGDVYYSMDKSYELSVGDVITVTAYTYSYGSMEEYCNDMGYQLMSDTKEFTVDGLDKYCDAIDEISDDIISELCGQAEDALYANMNLTDDETLNYVNYIGFYFLSSKDVNIWDSLNKVFLVYEVNVTNTYETVTYYTYVRFSDIILQSDGTNEIYDIMSYSMPYAYYKSDNAYIGSGEYTSWGMQSFHFYYVGYLSVDSLYNDAIRTDLEYYNIENNIPDSYFDDEEDIVIEENDVEVTSSEGTESEG